MKRNDNNDKSLKPHPNIDQERQNKEQRDTTAYFLVPQKLRDDDVTRNHDGIGRAVRALDAVHERILFVGIAAIPGNEGLRRVGQADNGAGQENDFAHRLDMSQRDVVL